MRHELATTADLNVATVPILSLFTCPKAFSGPTGRIQRNALANWRALGNSLEILLLGDDPGVVEAAEEFGYRHIPAIARNGYGTPLVNDIFRKGAEAALAAHVCYINADILLPPSLLEAVRTASGRWKAFLLAGRRWNAHITEELDFSGDWASRLEQIRLQRGVLFTPTGIDYFVFPKGQYADMPAFAIGRYAWDNWILRKSVAEGCPIVDATEFVPAVHQNHDYAHMVNAENNTRTENPECRENSDLLHRAFPRVWEGNSSLSAAGWRLTSEDIRRNWTRERLRWWMYFALNGLRINLRGRLQKQLGDEYFTKLLAVKRTLFGPRKKESCT